MKYIPTIGLEIHTELKTQTKMFCSCLNDSNEQRPNVNICPVCMGHPGTLPVANKAAIEAVIRVGSALQCEIAQFSKFDRKNYFYPDLPKGYQISQYDLPFCKRGYLEISGKRIGITRVHLEEDTARSQHDTKGKTTLIDFNRAGVPLMELVTEPGITSGEEAQAFAQELQLIVRYLGVSDADMEKGQMRVEVNISLREAGLNQSEGLVGRTDLRKSVLGTKVEIKNLNSFRSASRAIDYEITRQSELLKNGEKIKQETRGWDEAKQRTVLQRSKEEAQDYRYFPEPDLPPLTFTQADIEKIAATVPELPAQKRERFSKQFSLPQSDVEILVSEKGMAAYFEQTISELDEWLKIDKKEPEPEGKNKLYKLVVNYLISDMQKFVNENEMSFSEIAVTPENFAEYVKLIYEGRITSRVAKDILIHMFGSGADPYELVKAKGLEQISDDSEIEQIVSVVIKNNPKSVADYKKGKSESLQFLVGQVMKASKGKANPQKAETILKKNLI